MDIRVNRTAPQVQPPVQSVMITLSKKEAEWLTTLFGRLSYSNVETILLTKKVNDPDANGTYNLTANIYDRLCDEGLDVEVVEYNESLR